ncbi:MAG: hypothetical protein ACKVKF_18290 [Rhodobacterales bacterium]
MLERALNEEAMLAGLRDIRLPAEAPGGLLAEVFAALALGLLLAVGIGLVLRGLSRARPARQRAEDPLARIDALAPQDQRLALLALLKQRAPARYAVLAERLYQPDGLPDLGALRAEVMRHD